MESTPDNYKFDPFFLPSFLSYQFAYVIIYLLSYLLLNCFYLRLFTFQPFRSLAYWVTYIFTFKSGNREMIISLK